MSKELIIRSKSSSVDFALLKDGKLIEYQKEVGTNKFNVGDVFLAKIKKTLPGLNAAFVNVGSVSYTHLRAPRDRQKSRMPSSA